jgi:MATE family multidrug resistance protein
MAIPILNIFIFFDCLQGVGTGIIRGLGRQGLASTITITGYWIIGIPLSLASVFEFGWGIEGLWYGPTVACAFNFAFYYIMLVKTNWQEIADDVRKRKEAKQK